MSYIKITQQEKFKSFREKAISLWGYKYDYSKVEYKNSKTPIIIIYKGVEYKQTPIKHLQKKRCELSENTLSIEEFIKRSKEVWSDRFSYDSLVYKNMYTEITLFDTYNGYHITQIPTSHLAGSLPNIWFENFKKKCRYIYDNRYDYSESIFTNLSDPLTIKCLVHGEFNVRRAYDHLNMKTSCPCCDDLKLDKKIEKCLNRYNIDYKKQHYFNGCEGLFDFYIPSKRCCIDSSDSKKDYCEENFINLIIINKIEDIEDIIKQNLI